MTRCLPTPKIDEMNTRTRTVDDSSSTTSGSDGAASKQARPTRELERTPQDRHAFLFGHNVQSTPSSLKDFHPLPSLIPFLLDVFDDNVNTIARVVHLPTVRKMIRDLRGDMTKLSPANEALLFSIYYAAITSMEDEDVTINFGTSKIELNLKYRLGFEQALAKSDFLTVPDLVLVQALAIFLILLRRHDSPRFVWMMVGIAIRMANSLGLQRDGSHFSHLTPFEVEMRRRVWWCLCFLDQRSSEDQATEFTIGHGSSDTRIPLNINDDDIGLDSTDLPPEREGLTDMSISRVWVSVCDTTKRMVAQTTNETATPTDNLQSQTTLLDEMLSSLETHYLQYVPSTNILHWTTATVARLVIGKMILLTHLPVLFNISTSESEDQKLSLTIRTRLLIAAIEVAEYNHALNSNLACRQWRWVFQTYTHWHAIIYILLETSRRPWDPLSERAWIAMHSQWLIPVQSHFCKESRVWFPLRRLRATAERYRREEIANLQTSPTEVARLEESYRTLEIPSSSGINMQEHVDSASEFLKIWKDLVGGSHAQNTDMANDPMIMKQGSAGSSSGSTSRRAPVAPKARAIPPNALIPNTQYSTPSPYPEPPHDIANHQPGTILPHAHSQGQIDSNLLPWLWSDTSFSDPNNTSIDMDINMNLDDVSGIDWYNWVESAQGIERDLGMV